jgi:hypothetical protein
VVQSVTSGGISSPTSASRSQPMVSTGAGFWSRNSRNWLSVISQPTGSLVAYLLFLILACPIDPSSPCIRLTELPVNITFFRLDRLSSARALRSSSASSLSRASVCSSGSPSSFLTILCIVVDCGIRATSITARRGFLVLELVDKLSVCSALTLVSRRRELDRVDMTVLRI